MFEPGTKVMCINGTFGKNARGIHKKKPKKGVIYTVRDIIASQSAEGPWHDVPGVLLEEIVNPIAVNGCEPTFLYNRFADIETYMEMLEKEASGS